MRGKLFASVVLLTTNAIHSEGDNSLLTSSSSGAQLRGRRTDAVEEMPHPIAYMCGFESAYRPMAEAIFPEHHAVHLYDQPPLAEPKSNDVVIMGSHGICPFDWMKKEGIYKDWKILYFEQESEEGVPKKPGSMRTASAAVRPEIGGKVPTNVYTFGFYEDSNKAMRLPYVITSAFEINIRKVVEELVGAERRPVNEWKKDRFLMYYQRNCVGYREDAIGELSKIGKIDSGSRCMGPKELEGTSRYPRKVQIRTVLWELQDWNQQWMGGGVDARHALLKMVGKRHRFYLAMENYVQPGYITEKILNGFVAGAVPIYYGTEDVYEIFNKDAFIFYDINNPSPALEKVAYLESNRTAYYEMLTQPILAEGEKTVEKFFSLADDIGGGQLKRRIWELIGLTESTI